MRERIINGINCESIESFIAIYNCSRKYCIDKIDAIRFEYKEIMRGGIIFIFDDNK